MMIQMRLGSLCTRINLSPRFTFQTSVLNLSSKSDQAEYDKPLKLVEEDDINKPVIYSRTLASKHLAKHSRRPDTIFPPCQPHVILGSLAIFMLYFFILREENDIDEMLYAPLSRLVDGIDDSVGNTPRRIK